MKPLFIALSLLLMFSNVHADELSTDQTLLMSQADNITINQSLFSDDDTYFNQIGDLFAQGTLPSARETLGWWSGRCYKYDSPDKPTAALFVFEYNNSKHGPIFPRNIKMLFLVHKNSTSPDSLDNLTDDDKASVRKIIRSHNDPVRVENNSWLTRETTEFYAMELRKYQDYFVTRGSSSEGNELTVIHYYCYYFKKVYSY